MQIGVKEELRIQKFEPLPLRLIKYRYDNTNFYLGTTLFDQTKYPTELFSEVYHARWGIEELYKISKVLINIEDFHSRTERGVRQEIFAHFVLITLTRLLANQVESDLNGFALLNSNPKKSSEVSLPFDAPTKVNFKNCLAVVSRHLEELLYSATARLTSILDQMLTNIRVSKQKFRSARRYTRISLKPVGKWRQPTKHKLALAHSTARKQWGKPRRQR